MTTHLTGVIVEESGAGVERIALVEFNGRRRPIYLNLVPEAKVGDFVRFHAGFATECVAASESRYIAEENCAHLELKLDPDTLRAYRLLIGLEPAQLRKMLPLAEEKQYPAGELIFNSGEQSLYLHLIVEGDVLLEEDTNPRPLPVQALHAGDAMGWSSLTEGPKTHFRAVALTHVSTVAWPGSKLRAACALDPVLGYALMKRLVEMVAERLDTLRAKLAGRD